MLEIQTNVGKKKPDWEKWCLLDQKPRDTAMGLQLSLLHIPVNGAYLCLLF